MPDTLTVTITDSLGCEFTGTVVVDFLVSAMQFSEDGLHFTVYPNPNRGKFFLSTNYEPLRKYELKIYNILGEMVMFRVFSGSYIRTTSYFVDVNLPEGIYALWVETDDGQVVDVKKVVIVR